MNTDQYHATESAAPEAVLGQFQTDYPLQNFNASEAASAIAKAADVAIIVDNSGVIVDVAVNVDDLVTSGAQGWVGRSLADVVTVESQTKVEALLRDDGTGLRRWRQVNHPGRNEIDIPVEYAVIHIAPDGGRILAGRELTGVANLQQRLIEAQQSMEREYARVRGAETRYRVLFQLTSDAVVIVDAESERIAEANPAALELLEAKTKRPSLIGFATLIASADIADVEAMFANVRATGHSDAVKVRTTSGREVILTVSLFSQTSKTFFLVQARGAEADLMSGRKPKSRLLDLISQMPEGFVMCDADGVILSANAAFVELTQTASLEQVHGEPISRWIGRTEIDATVLLNALKKKDAVQRYATLIRGEHGGSEQVEVAAVAVRTINGEACYGMALRLARPEPIVTAAGLERSGELLTELVGSVPLKELVREATDLIERMCIEAALRMTDDNRASAAEVLGVSRQSLYNKMRRYDLLAPGVEAE